MVIFQGLSDVGGFFTKKLLNNLDPSKTSRCWGSTIFGEHVLLFAPPGSRPIKITPQ